MRKVVEVGNSFNQVVIEVELLKIRTIKVRDGFKLVPVEM